jgi:hypothetical protein
MSINLFMKGQLLLVTRPQVLLYHLTKTFFLHTGKTEFHYQGNEITKDIVQNHSTTHKKLRNHQDIWSPREHIAWKTTTNCQSLETPPQHRDVQAAHRKEQSLNNKEDTYNFQYQKRRATMIKTWSFYPANGTSWCSSCVCIEGLACGSKELSTSPPQHPGSLVPSDPPWVNLPNILERSRSNKPSQ